MLLSIQDLKVSFRMGEGKRADAVRGVSFDVPENATVALVGESGSGKSVTAMSVLNLLPDNAERTGRILWNHGGQERDLLRAGTAELQRMRGKEIACVFQDPMSSLNPVFTVGQQLTEPLIKHLGLSRRAAWERALALLHEVGIPEPKRRLGAYPHELSGGQQQRVMIAMALACEPRLLIADEPTTALDVTIQAQILDLMRELQQKTGTAIVLITHDLGVVAEMAERVVVMYAGRKVEEASVLELFARPRHPYTRGLLHSIPKLGAVNGGARGERTRLAEIAGTVPSLAEPIVGCAFAPRCGYATPRCRTESPPLEEKAVDHVAACWESDRIVYQSENASPASGAHERMPVPHPIPTGRAT